MKQQLTLQRLILPDLTICTEFDMYFRMFGTVIPDLEANRLRFAEGSSVRFDTYMNIFNLGTWQGFCTLDGLALQLTGEGRFRVRLREMKPDMAECHCFYDEDTMLSARPRQIDVFTAAESHENIRLIAVELYALTDGVLSDGRFVATVASQPAGDDPKIRLAISITTFRREDEVANTVCRVAAFLAEHEDENAATGIDAHLFVVDNGQSVELDPHPKVTLIPNANLGGSGGFARGLVAAQDNGYTHCLFMDDDASFEMENLVRTMAFLRLADDDRTALAGGMITNSKKWVMWENGAVFNSSCRPQFMGTDLREVAAMVKMEIEAALPKPYNFYGGWWYFAFPIRHVSHYPYPFFVRGDDISFSLANDFKPATLSGVVSFQDEFGSKESPLTLYLDLRNHLHHHLTQPELQIGKLRTLKIFWRFFLRSVVRLHYETAEAKIVAFTDILNGPDVFSSDADMSRKRSQILGLIDKEKWRPTVAEDLLEAVSYMPPNRLYLQFLKFSLNGHLVPFWGFRKSGYRILLRDRGLVWPFWGITAADLVNYDAVESYHVEFDRKKFLTLAGQAIRLSFSFLCTYDKLVAQYRDDYHATAKKPFWLKQFRKK
jgi:galactofuranosylgalactofuranosylrhamnosyl-N-acetylglucosaminyl-diphospho-decaprenol beta-1,5/1,6-galactofuranosyltransferase